MPSLHIIFIHLHHIVYILRVSLNKPQNKSFSDKKPMEAINPLNVELYPICHLLALVGAHYILHVSRIRVKVIYI